MATRAKSRACPLCGQDVGGDDLDALGRHFEECPKTDGGRPAGTDRAGKPRKA